MSNHPRYIFRFTYRGVEYGAAIDFRAKRYAEKFMKNIPQRFSRQEYISIKSCFTDFLLRTNRANAPLIAFMFNNRLQLEGWNLIRDTPILLACCIFVLYYNALPHESPMEGVEVLSNLGREQRVGEE